MEIEVPAILSRKLITMQYVKDLENFIGRVLRASKEKSDMIIRKRNWVMSKEDKDWIAEIVGISTEGIEPSDIQPEEKKTPTEEQVLPIGEVPTTLSGLGRTTVT
jgi:hypothetical protein